MIRNQRFIIILKMIKAILLKTLLNIRRLQNSLHQNTFLMRSIKYLILLINILILSNLIKNQRFIFILKINHFIIIFYFFVTILL